MKISKHINIYSLLLMLLLLCVTLPRFNRHDFAIGSITSNGIKELGDASQYISIVQYFRGDLGIEALAVPFTYRPLVPLVASILPFDPMTSINLVNLASMLICIVFMYKIFDYFGFSEAWKFLGGVLFVVSFPVFYYSTIGYIDASLICAITVGLYFVIEDKYGCLLITLCIGVFVKETIVILILVWVVYNVISKRFDLSEISRTILLIAAVYISYRIAKNVIPLSQEYVWEPSVQSLFFNIGRARTWLSFILSFGIPGFISVFLYWFRKDIFSSYRREVVLTMLIGLLLSLLLFVYSLLSAYADGRFVWVSYPFSVPLSLMIIKGFHNKLEYKNTKILRLLKIFVSKQEW